MPENQPKTIRLYDLVLENGCKRAASINTCPPLEVTDPLFDWINRGFDLYGGICKDPRLRPLAA